ncbi:MAG: segregation and condensation protein A [Chromatiales bacterium]|jgi:hypothetical protein|nr:segregation and condensation protein A [Chromatiales bacterium]MDX9767013.1 segregation and condensation protein A [Ectothiorhodospiraceae bacterium]
MIDQELSKEERILRIMRRVLTDVARETFTRPGHQHPLSDKTIDGMREALGLIAAREHELAEAAGRPSQARPRYRYEEPAGDSVVVPIDISALRGNGDKKGGSEH